MFKLEISGFRSQAEVKAFIEWYGGQGEQDAELWFECRMDEGEIDRSFMPVDGKATYPIKFEGNTGFMVIK